jgi:DNA invertase Pin-like site-specific DNA recombinase
MKDIELNIKKQGRSKTWLMSELGISRRTFYERLKSNTWKNDELAKLKNLNLIG